MNKNIMIFAGVFAALLVAVLVMRSQPAKVGVKELKMESIDKDKVTKIEVTIPGKEAKEKTDSTPAQGAEPAKAVVLEKSAGAWKVYDASNAAKKFAVEETQIKAALDAIGEFKTGDLIANNKDQLAEFEIDDAKGNHVKLTVEGGKGMDLLFGRAAKGGGSTVRVAGSDDVFVAKGRLGTSLKKDVAQWRKKTLVDVKADEIVGINVKPLGAVGFAAAATTPPAAPPADDAAPVPAAKPQWALTDPATLPAGFRLDASLLGRVAQSFVGLRAQDFSEDSDEVAGLSGAHSVVEATTKDGKKIVVHLGKEDDKKRVYVRVDGDPQLYWVSSFSTKQVQKTLDDLRDMSLMTAALDDVEQVTFTGKGGKAIVKKDGAEWKLVEPKKPPAEFDASQIPAQIAAVLRVKAARISDAKVNFAKGSPTVELALKGGKKQLLVFGDGLPGDAPAAGPKTAPAESREFYVKGSADGLTYVIAGFTRGRYDKPLDLFKKPPDPPQGMGMGGPGGAMTGLSGLPPDVRKKLEESMKQQH